MTPEQAESVFYGIYGAGRWGEPGKPIVQRELRNRCWQAVIDAVRAEYSRELAGQMLTNIERDAK